MSNTVRKTPYWCQNPENDFDREMAEEFKRGKVPSPINGWHPFCEEWSPAMKRLAKRLAGKARRQGRVPKNFRK